MRTCTHPSSPRCVFVNVYAVASAVTCFGPSSNAGCESIWNWERGSWEQGRIRASQPFSVPIARGDEGAPVKGMGALMLRSTFAENLQARCAYRFPGVFSIQKVLAVQ